MEFTLSVNQCLMTVVGPMLKAQVQELFQGWVLEKGFMYTVVQGCIDSIAAHPYLPATLFVSHHEIARRLSCRMSCYFIFGAGP